LTLPNNGNIFAISGTTSFALLNYGWLGREITLVFNGVLTVTHGTGTVASIFLSGTTNFTTGAGTTLSLKHNGSQWYETSRT
jgi:hypothetical protein